MASKEEIEEKKKDLEIRVRTTLTGVISATDVTTEEGASIKATVEAFKKDWGVPLDNYLKLYGCVSIPDMLAKMPHVVKIRIGPKGVKMLSMVENEEIAHVTSLMNRASLDVKQKKAMGAPFRGAMRGGMRQTTRARPLMSSQMPVPLFPSFPTERQSIFSRTTTAGGHPFKFSPPSSSRPNGRKRSTGGGQNKISDTQIPMQHLASSAAAGVRSLFSGSLKITQPTQTNLHTLLQQTIDSSTPGWSYFQSQSPPFVAFRRDYNPARCQPEKSIVPELPSKSDSSSQQFSSSHGGELTSEMIKEMQKMFPTSYRKSIIQPSERAQALPNSFTSSSFTFREPKNPFSSSSDSKETDHSTKHEEKQGTYDFGEIHEQFIDSFEKLNLDDDDDEVLEGEGWESVEMAEPFYNPLKPAEEKKITLADLNRYIEKAGKELPAELFNVNYMRLAVPVELIRNPSSARRLIISKKERASLTKAADNNEKKLLAWGKEQHEAKFNQKPH